MRDIIREGNNELWWLSYISRETNGLKEVCWELKDLVNYEIARIAFSRLHPETTVKSGRTFFKDLTGKVTEFEIKKSYQDFAPFQNQGSSEYIFVEMQNQREYLLYRESTTHGDGTGESNYVVHKDFYSMIPGAAAEREKMMSELDKLVD